MTMRGTSEISTHPLPEASDDTTPFSEICLNGARTGKLVEGAFLEAAFTCNDVFLIFLTDGIPHEETLRIYLLDRAANILDWARLGAMYSTGHLSGLQPIQPDTVRFRFFGDTDWVLTVLPAQVFAWPVLFDPPGVKRPFGFTRRFHLTGKPRPEARE
ncbi:hypothetical protein [Massilia sp. METH4]|uniref:hypothetical protein n=1 Tax=Massilia sp. METH4 TaxID=3123041 RepID=UPI0030D21E2E